MLKLKWRHHQDLRLARWKTRQVNRVWQKNICHLSDEHLAAKTQEFRERLAKGATLNDILVEVFAVAKEAIIRKLGMTLFDVQIAGAYVLFQGNVAEMRTGEGKTITSIPVVYLHALTGQSTIVSTVNEYLTTRDATDNGKVYKFLGLSVGINKQSLNSNEKRKAYAADITYSIHSEVGFDYLRDNMVKVMSDKVQRPFAFCLIDEVDSILIDEAKTPLIISGGKGDTTQIYVAADQFCKTLQGKDYKVDQETKGISLTGTGVKKAQSFFNVKNLFAVQSSELVHRIQNALQANFIMKLDIEYIVRKDKLILVDLFTGRVMPGRAYSDGLQQAVQAKEGIKIEPETKTLATITYQNLFRLFKKLCGMTGTAKTEEQEFMDIYNMRVVVVPTNLPMIRKDLQDHIYAAKKHKLKAIMDEIKRRHKEGWPILLGTSAIEDSEEISVLLRQEGFKFQILNAKNDELEAKIVARAGQPGAITISTNMAGRGTDIKINPAILAAGHGLFVLGTDKAEARRIDNQLRGRSGRQGEYGESRFIISLDDQLLKRFSAQEKLKRTFKHLGDKPIVSKMMSRALLRAQKKIENMNFDSRKQVLDYDDVIRQQRDVIYRQRDIIIGQSDLIDVIKRLFSAVVREVQHLPNFLRPDKSLNHEVLVNVLNQVWFSTAAEKIKVADVQHLHAYELANYLREKLTDTYLKLRAKIMAKMGEEFLHNYEREMIINTFDQNWQQHIDTMDKIRSSVSLSSYAQKNPIQIYIQKGHDTFQELVRKISHNVTRILMVDRFGAAAPVVQKPAVHPLNVQREEEVVVKQPFVPLSNQVDPDEKPTVAPRIPLSKPTEE